MKPELTVAYDITAVPFPVRELFLPSLVAIVLAVVWVLWTRYKRPPYKAARVMPWLALIFSVVWSVAWAGPGTVNFLRARRAMVEGRANVLEGIVHDFVPEPSQGHASECFSVQDKSFCYARHVLMPGFRQSQPADGPIHNGLHVRVHYLDDDILKLEIAATARGTR
jgi:hypothetical protein